MLVLFCIIRVVLSGSEDRRVDEAADESHKVVRRESNNLYGGEVSNRVVCVRICRYKLEDCEWVDDEPRRR